MLLGHLNMFNWYNLLWAIQILASLAIIALVLLQHGKGADAGAAFGAGASGSLFGASGSSNFLSRSTAVAAAIFFGCTLLLAFMGNRLNSGAAGAGGGVFDRTPAAVHSAPAASQNKPSDQIPK